MVMRNAIHAPAEECKFVKKRTRRGNGPRRAHAAWVQQPEENIVDRNFEEMSTEVESPDVALQDNAADGVGSTSIITSRPDFVPDNHSHHKRAREAEEAQAQEEA